MVETSIERESGWIVQFSFYLPNKVGCLHDLLAVLSEEKLMVLGLCALDHVEGMVVRLVVNYPDQARKVLDECGFEYVTHELLGIRIPEASRIDDVLCALNEAEINIFFLYPLMAQSQSRPIIVLSLEDKEFSYSALQACGFNVLKQNDLAR